MTGHFGEIIFCNKHTFRYRHIDNAYIDIDHRKANTLGSISLITVEVPDIGPEPD